MTTRVDTSESTAAILQLGELSRRLSETVVLEASHLEVAGRPPSDQLLKQLEQYCSRFAALHRELRAGLEQEEAETEDLGLSDLERLVDDGSLTSEVIRLDDFIHSLEHRDDAGFGPLEACRRLALQIRTSVQQKTLAEDVREDLLAGRHPLQALTELLQSVETLDDSRWTDLTECVEQAFGRALTTAVTRGRLVSSQLLVGLVPESTVRPTVDPPAERAVAVAEAVPSVDTAATNELSAQLPAAVDASTDTCVAITEPAVLAPLPAVSRLPVRSSFGSSRLGASTKARRPLPLLASEIEQSVGDDRKSKLGELVNELTVSGQLTFAACLSQSLADRRLPTPIPPWVLRSILLSRALASGQGELARRLEADLQSFRRDDLPTDADERLGLELLLRAAVLPVALLAPSAAVTTILRALPISPPLAQLYNYCLRLSTCGDRLKSIPSILSAAQSQGRLRLSPDLEPLRQAALEQTDAVHIELNALSRESASRLVAAGIAECRRSVRHVHTIFSEERPLPVREAEPTRVLRGELLRIPTVRLDPQWEPMGGPVALEAELLTALQRPVPDWRGAFEAHCERGDHLATGRILDLGEWTHDEREALQAMRERCLTEGRQQLVADWTELSQEIDLAVREQRLSLAQATALKTDGPRLLHEASQCIDFPEAWRQLEIVRQRLDQSLGGGRGNLSRPNDLIADEPNDTSSTDRPAPVPPSSTTDSDWIFDLFEDDAR